MLACLVLVGVRIGFIFKLENIYIAGPNNWGKVFLGGGSVAVVSI